jgi:hypothetical protein
MRLPVFARKMLSHAPPASDDGSVRLVVLTQDEPFYKRLHNIATACEWRIGRAQSLEEVETQIVSDPGSIVVYERDWDGGDWRSALGKLYEIPVHPCILLASRVADEYLWREVVRNHGFDILPVAAPDEKLIRVLKFAWTWVRSKYIRGVCD